MKKGNSKLFSDKNKLVEMLSLYQQGWGFCKLGRKYECNHSSIYYQVKKYNVQQTAEVRAKIQIVLENKKIKKVKRKQWAQRQKDNKYNFPKINRGKLCYQDYVDEAEKKKKEKLLNLKITEEISTKVLNK